MTKTAIKFIEWKKKMQKENGALEGVSQGHEKWGGVAF